MLFTCLSLLNNIPWGLTIDVLQSRYRFKDGLVSTIESRPIRVYYGKKNSKQHSLSLRMYVVIYLHLHLSKVKNIQKVEHVTRILCEIDLNILTLPDSTYNRCSSDITNKLVRACNFSACSKGVFEGRVNTLKPKEQVEVKIN